MCISNLRSATSGLIETGDKSTIDKLFLCIRSFDEIFCAELSVFESLGQLDVIFLTIFKVCEDAGAVPFRYELTGFLMGPGTGPRRGALTYVGCGG